MAKNRTKPKNKRELTYNILKDQGGVCYYCCHVVFLSKGNVRKAGERIATIDHIIPKAEKGSNAKANLVVACRKCNQERNQERFETFLLRKFKETL